MIRITFSKSGFTRFISHLDLMRCMSRIFARAEVPIWYTEGFNPHPYMVFSAALPVGVYGECELLDIKLTKDTPFDELLSRMNAAAPEGIKFLGIHEGGRDFADIVKASYTVRVPAEISASFSEFLKLPEIIVTKKTKRGDARLDLKNEMEILNVSTDENCDRYEMLFPCGNEKNISPVLLTGAFASETGCDVPISVTRTGFLSVNGEDIG